MEALRASGCSPSLLAFYAADFGKVCRNRTADSNSATPRRESSRAVYWTSVPGMKKELAAYCRNRASRRDAAREAGGSVSRDDATMASAGARIVSDSIFARDAVEQWGGGGPFYDEVDTRLGWAEE